MIFQFSLRNIGFGGDLYNENDVDVIRKLNESIHLHKFNRLDYQAHLTK